MFAIGDETERVDMLLARKHRLLLQVAVTLLFSEPAK